MFAGAQLFRTMVVMAKSPVSGLSVRLAADKSGASRLCNELFRFRFGMRPELGAGDNVFQLHINPIGRPAPDEIWFTDGPVSSERVGDYAITQCADYLAIHVEIDLEPGTDFKELTTRVYRELLQLTRERDYPNLVRVWNYFPGINVGAGDHELYRQFTAGRAVAFGGFEGELLPAATAIGTDEGTPLTITMIAARHQCRMIENPRQTSAYKYPRQFGPSSPSFSRAVVVAAESGYRILMSGTASIIGHQSMHLDDPAQQTAESLRNLDQLIQQARRPTRTSNGADEILTDGCLRIYVRQPAQVTEIKTALRDFLVDDPNVVFLRGDICRRELLLEIEAAGSI